jgi:hypothetical protein
LVDTLARITPAAFRMTSSFCAADCSRADRRSLEKPVRSRVTEAWVTGTQAEHMKRAGAARLFRLDEPGGRAE